MIEAVFQSKNQLNRALTLACLNILTVFSLFTPLAFADAAERAKPFEVQVKNPQELTELLDVTRAIVFSPKLYEHLNKVFAEHLTVSEELQKEYNWPSRTKGLSEPQILFLLKNLDDFHKIKDLLDRYIARFGTIDENDPLRKELAEPFKREFQDLVNNSKVTSDLRGLNDPSKSLTLSYQSGRPTFTDFDVHFNQPTFVDHERQELGTLAPEDLKKIFKDHITQAKRTMSLNIFEFNLLDVADDLEAAVNRGVRTKVGIDRSTTLLAPENKAVLAKLVKMAGVEQSIEGLAIEEIEKLLSNVRSSRRRLFTLTLVNATGLNHQKILNVDAGTAHAKTIFSSGNLTQSCLGKEGDAVNLDPQLRPATSIPNANHIVVYRNPLASVVIEHELFKTIDLKRRGQKQYPISGSYSFLGQRSPGETSPAKMTIAFSPNGGMGDVSSSLIRPQLMQAQGQIFMMQFVASAPKILDTIIEIAAKDPTRFDFKFVGDPPFAMQSWSIPLLLSIMNRDDVTKKYFENKDSPLLKIMDPDQIKQLQDSIRVNPKKYGEFHYTIEGKSLKISVKLHHKVFILPRINLAILGTSFNPSLSAEGNQEQILMIQNHPVVKKTINAFMYELATSPMTVVQRARMRTKYIERRLDSRPINRTDEPLEDRDLVDTEIREMPNDLESKQVSRDRSKVKPLRCQKFYR